MSELEIEGCVKKINPSDKVLEDSVYSCQDPTYQCQICRTFYTFDKVTLWECPVCSKNKE